MIPTEKPQPVILCIESRAPTLAQTKMALESSGYTVLTATSVRDAHRRLRDSHVDLVLSDHYLKNELGTALAAGIKALYPGIPILLISGAQDIPQTPYIDGVIFKADTTISLLVSIARALGL
jgi:DNA-binding NtrC family response regulator